MAKVQLEETDLELDYAIPADLEGRVQPGTRVYVPLQNRREPAIVIAVSDFVPGSYKFKLKPIAQVIGRHASFTPPLLNLARWVADYYLCSEQQVLRSMLPGVVREQARELHQGQPAHPRRTHFPLRSGEAPHQGPHASPRHRPPRGTRRSRHPQ